jgi:excisionase family DNA binding protein
MKIQYQHLKAQVRPMKRQTIEIPIPDCTIPKLAYSIEEAALALNMGKSMVFNLIHEGRLGVVRLGDRKVIIPITELQDFLTRNLSKTPGDC